MKYLPLVALCTICIATPGFAGIYGSDYGSKIDQYDPETGLYLRYLPQRSSNDGIDGIFSIAGGSKSHTSNIALYDPKTDKIWTIFNTNPKRVIKTVLFEVRNDDGSIRLNHSHPAKNAPKDIQRALRDKILIVTEDDSEHSKTLWIANRNGKDVKKLTSIPTSHNWHIDLKNNKIRIISTTDGELSITSFDW